MGPLPSLIRFIDETLSGQIELAGPMTLALGNVPAIEKNQRFIEEDLNRTFDVFDDRTSDRKRAKELATLIDQCDYLIDFHQTINPTHRAFFIFVDKPENENFCLDIGTTATTILFHQGQDATVDYKTSIDYADRRGKTGFCIEVSEQGYNPEADQLTYETLCRAVQVTQFQKSFRSQEKLDRFVISHAEKFSNPNLQLKPGLKNFDAIRKGDILGRSKVTHESILAPKSGYILFPKYLDKDPLVDTAQFTPQDLYLLLKKEGE